MLSNCFIPFLGACLEAPVLLWATLRSVYAIVRQKDACNVIDFGFHSVQPEPAVAPRAKTAALFSFN